MRPVGERRTRWLWLGAIALAPAASNFDSTLQRFQAMSLESRLSDSFTTINGIWPDRSARIAISRPVFDSLGGGALTPRQRAEWASRLGASAAHLDFRDLVSVRSPSLVDEALWALLVEKVPDPFASDVDWTLEMRPFRNLLRSRSDAEIKAMEHHAWWTWLRDGSLTADAEPTLKALHNYVQGLLLRGSLRGEAFLRARAALGEASGSLDERLFDEFRRDFPNPAALCAWIADQKKNDLKSARVPLLRSFAGYWTEKKQFVAASEAEARALLVRFEEGGKLSARELLRLARLELEAGKNVLAQNFSTRAIRTRGDNQAQRSEDPGFLAEALETLASASLRVANEETTPEARRTRLQWAAEYHRRALIEAGQSRTRTRLMLDYGQILMRLGYLAEAAELYDVGFNEAVDNPSRVGLLRASAAVWENETVRRMKSGEKARSDSAFRNYVTKLSLMVKNSPGPEALRGYLRRARELRKRLGLGSDLLIGASLHDVERALGSGTQAR